MRPRSLLLVMVWVEGGCSAFPWSAPAGVLCSVMSVLFGSRIPGPLGLGSFLFFVLTYMGGPVGGAPQPFKRERQSITIIIVIYIYIYLSLYIYIDIRVYIYIHIYI